ncbi:hypothetical protein CKM354_000231500 [Cercospora kikuchii]|uniref:Chromo domain-containing protein n=1 Tax=Cercospora kikuchii TaxID=84275 RepID=A0A9P3CC81_9PEZI|nr:uncharacterized protein CKM354_000231500 [Cercospora kikuchii]GIZ38916.1 hypothetical protein CKM354_000231500 [Cercospora kikuchii]
MSSSSAPRQSSRNGSASKSTANNASNTSTIARQDASQFPRPPPTRFDAYGVPQYYIETILESKKLDDEEVQYLTLWEGYPLEEATWETRSTLGEDAQEAIKDFQRREREKRMAERRKA